MEKAYNAKETENKIYEMWQKEGYFAGKVDKNKPPFCIIMPPPNANGVLHIGHAVFVSLQDIMVRYHRLKGDSVLWLPGFDHAGIATQVVYEKKLAEQDKTRFDVGREEFFKQTAVFSMDNAKSMKAQLMKLGASCDWEKAKFTLDDDISKMVSETFVNLYKKGLIYRGKRIINWCLRCQTALSDLEVIHKDKQAKLYYINYPIVGKKGFVQVATTRPETMLGDTAVAVNPNDKRYQKLLKAKVKLKLPIVGRAIPLVGDEAVDMEFGTGAVKVTPAHSLVDFEIAQRNKLPLIKVINEQGKMTKEAGSSFAGLKIKECQEKVIDDLKRLGFLEKEEDYAVSIALCDRCKSTLEPLISKQWFLKAKDLATPAMEVVRKGDIEFIPPRFEKVYFHWMENIRDWCISRQLWWGHRIPVWYREQEVYVGTEPPQGEGWVQDEDTLDTWFSSGQWPQNTLNSLGKEYFEYFYPTAVMETGWDILFFWVARMIMLGLFQTSKIPFKYVYLHGLVRDQDKQKMSKSKGNVINPLAVIDDYGADALRMALVFGTGAGNDIIVTNEKILGQKKFANKVWNASRFVLQKTEDVKSFSFTATTQADKDIIKKLADTTKAVTGFIEGFQFHQAAEMLYQFFWHNFCDVYIEKSKEQMNENTTALLLYVLKQSLIMLHPFMPFITEEIYQALPNKEKPALIIEKWPEVSPHEVSPPSGGETSSN